MYLTEHHIIKQKHPFYKECDKLCFKSKNLYNYANYIVRQEFIKTSKEKDLGLIEHANYLGDFYLSKNIKDNENYKQFPQRISNTILKNLDSNWKLFFTSIKKWSKDKTSLRGKPNLPNYLDKIKGRFVTIYYRQSLSQPLLKQGIIKLSQTNIQFKTFVNPSLIQQVRIVPKNGYYVIEVIYKKEIKELKSDNKRYASIDLGLNNLATIGSNAMKPFIINGKPLKSINQYYNKKLAKLKSKTDGNKQTSKRIKRLHFKRNNKIKDYLHKASRCIINQLVSNSINTLVIAHNKEWKQEINIGSVNNQKFVSIPHSRFIDMLKYKASLEGINVILQEESYTSKCSFLDNETIQKHECYKGTRVKRGLFKSKEHGYINADVNGALNILRKAVKNAFKMANLIEVSSSPLVYTMKFN